MILRRKSDVRINDITDGAREEHDTFLEISDEIISIKSDISSINEQITVINNQNNQVVDELTQQEIQDVRTLLLNNDIGLYS